MRGQDRQAEKQDQKPKWIAALLGWFITKEIVFWH
jgi:hypothetical protein